MAPSFLETGARFLVTRFFQRFIAIGCLILMEEGGETLTFEGTRQNSHLKVVLRVRKPQFYWKVATGADLGFADAYLDGDIYFVDANEGLLNFLLLIIANTEMEYHTSKLSKGRWWANFYHTSIVSSAKNIFKRLSRKNTLSQARNNISKHYDLSNELFSLFMDESMTYSCAIFQNPGEDLKNAQLRKVHTLIEKDKIEFLLCDYRQLPNNYKYDRIISCEMIEHVGHEFMEDFFKCCESSLAKNGILVLQFISVADEKYEEWRRSYGFGQEYIFNGGCLPSLNRVITAMAAASRLSVVHLEERGTHYYETLRVWRHNFLRNKRLWVLDLMRSS